MYHFTILRKMRYNSVLHSNFIQTETIKQCRSALRACKISFFLQEVFAFVCVLYLKKIFLSSVHSSTPKLPDTIWICRLCGAKQPENPYYAPFILLSRFDNSMQQSHLEGESSTSPLNKEGVEHCSLHWW